MSIHAGYLRIPNADAPIYRIVSLPRFREILRDRELFLPRPSAWDDPFEELLSLCAVTPRSGGPQQFFDQTRRPVFGQCWSMTRESDSLWRAYSVVINSHRTKRNERPDEEGVQLRSTPRKLLEALRAGLASADSDSCFVGHVNYLPQHRMAQFIANEIGRDRLTAFPGAEGHAESVLFKRSAFEHEAEVRLIYVGNDSDRGRSGVSVPIEPETIFDDAVFDPRLVRYERLEREDECRSLGFSAIGQSDLYQRVLFEIVVD